MYRHYNIIPDIRRLTGKRYEHLEEKIKEMDEKELKDFKRFLNDLNYKITRLEKKNRMGFRVRKIE
jgi:hypothetical protein